MSEERKRDPYVWAECEYLAELRRAKLLEVAAIERLIDKLRDLAAKPERLSTDAA